MIVKGVFVIVASSVYITYVFWLILDCANHSIASSFDREICMVLKSVK